jgi:broad specificity phosphatase PhoE
MAMQIVFETHSFSEDNERGIATGWLPGCLSERGRAAARALGARRRADDIAAVFTSDLARAVETAEIAFDCSSVPLLRDWRLRECDYGAGNGSAAADMHVHRAEHLDEPYPAGESWRAAVARVSRVLPDLWLRWSERRVLLIGHMATYYALEHRLRDIPLEQLLTEPFDWQEGWEYELPAP